LVAELVGNQLTLLAGGEKAPFHHILLTNQIPDSRLFLVA